jgi:hypothetical protein
MQLLECGVIFLLVVLYRVDETLNPILSDFTKEKTTVDDKRKSVAKQYYQSSFLQQVSMYKAADVQSSSHVTVGNSGQEIQFGVFLFNQVFSGIDN